MVESLNDGAKLTERCMRPSRALPGRNQMSRSALLAVTAFAFLACVGCAGVDGRGSSGPELQSAHCGRSESWSGTVPVGAGNVPILPMVVVPREDSTEAKPAPLPGSTAAVAGVSIAPATNPQRERSKSSIHLLAMANSGGRYA